MKMSVWVILVLALSPLGFSQDEKPEGLVPSASFANGAKISSKLSPALEVHGFYGSIRSFTSVMRVSRISGKGWALEPADRKEWNGEVEKALSKRQAFLDGAAKLTETTDEFWSRVFDSEIESQVELEQVLKSALPPHEVEAFIIEHYKDLGDCLISSSIFRDTAKIDGKTYKSLVANRRKGLEVISNMVRGRPQPGSLQQIGSSRDLDPEQLRLLFVLQGRMESDMPLEKHFELVSQKERDFFINDSPKLREYLMSKQKTQ